MTTKDKALLFILIGVLVSAIEISIFQDLNNNIESRSKELDSTIAKMDAAFGHPQHLPPPTNGVTSSYHEKDGKKNYEDSWIQDIDQKTGLVLVTTKDSKVSIIFKPAADDLNKFHVGWLTPVTFQCTKIKKKKCDFKATYKLFVSNGLVEVKKLIFPKK